MKFRRNSISTPASCSKRGRTGRDSFTISALMSGFVVVSAYLPFAAPGDAHSSAPVGHSTAPGHVLEASRELAIASNLGASVSIPHVNDITLRVDPERAGLGAYTETWGDNLVFDKNGDGNPDVLLSYHYSQPWEIWLGTEGSAFTLDRTLARKDRHHCAAADFGGPQGAPDGRMDLYCVRGANKGTLDNKRNELLLQQPDGGFINVVASWGAIDPSGRGRAVSILDIRGDGKPSIFLGNKASNQHPSLDHIFENVGDRFVQRRAGGLPSERDSRCSSTGDFDRDGRQDFLSCSFSLRLYRNVTTAGGPVAYRQMAGLEGIPVGGRLDAEMSDLNRDGWPDLVTLTRNVLEVRLNTQTTPHFPLVDFRLPMSGGYSFCSGNANGDGARDLLVVRGVASNADQFQRPDRMLINTGSGDAFEIFGVPQPPTRAGGNGNGDTCSAIPNYQGGRAAWVISNGRSSYGPEEVKRFGYRQLVILSP